MLEEGPKDNPNYLLEFVDTLDSYERNIFQKGYITALYRLLDQIVDSKTKIAYKIMDESTSERGKMILQARIDILDIYENHYSELIDTLEGRSQLQS